MPAAPNATTQIEVPSAPARRRHASRAPAPGLRRTPQVSVRGRLVRLTALLLLPCLALSALLTWQVYQTARLGAEAALREAASGLGQLLEKEFAQADVLLRTLAATDELKRADLAALDRLARKARIIGGAVVLADETGQELLDTALPPGAALPSTKLSPLPRDTEPGTPTVLPLQHTRQGGLELRVALSLAEGGAAGHHPAQLWLAVPAAALQVLLTGEALPSGWRSTILDPAGTIAARNIEEAHYLGAHASPGLLAALAASPVGMRDGVALDGTPAVLAFKRSARTGWSVVVASPRRLVVRAGRTSSTLLAVLGSATVLIGLLGALRVAAGIARPVEALAQATRVLGQDGSWTPIPQGLAEADAVARAMVGAAGALRDRQAQLGEANARLQDRVEARTSELAHANLALDEQRRFLAVILDQMPAGILVHDSGGRLTFANVAAQHLLSLTGTGVTGAAWPVGHGTPVEDSPTALACAGIATERSLLGIGSPRGGTIDLEVSASPLRDADGVVIAAVTILQDVTARLQAEEARRRSQRLEAVGQLTGGVAHEFNNLLMAILGSLELLARPVATLDNARAASLLDNATRAAGRGSRLTSQLLAFARRQVLQMEHVDLSALVSGMQDLLEGTLGRGIQVKVVAEPCEWLARADAAQIELMLLNLAINARDAMPNGGSLTIRSACVRTGQPSRAEDPPPGEYAVLQVCDNGEGMSQAVLARAFEPFFTTKAAGRGTGLGLPQVLGVARQMGGGVTIASAPGAGTTVSVFFPRAEAEGEVRAAPPPVPLEDRRLAGARVLLVDDDADVRVVARAILEEVGATVIEADSGAAALLVLRTRSVDLVLADLTMPNMSGVELAAEVAAIAPALPVVVMTGYGLDTFADPEGHVRRTLQKPFRADTLAATLVEVLGQDAG